MARKKDTKKGFIVRKEEDKKIHVRPIENGEVIDTPVEKVVKSENIELISSENKPINKNIKSEPISVHEKFIKIPRIEKENKKIINIKNGRVYKKLGNGYGIYADNGQLFKL